MTEKAVVSEQQITVYHHVQCKFLQTVSVYDTILVNTTNVIYNINKVSLAACSCDVKIFVGERAQKNLSLS
jgi:hypothetical protein